MRCVSFCTAETFNLQQLAQHFKVNHYVTSFHRDVLHVQLGQLDKHIFFFNIGSFVTWGLTKREELSLKNEIKAFEIESNKHIEEDHFIYKYGEFTNITTHERYNADIITLENDDIQIKLAISYGLAQSVKLETYEDSIQQTIQINRRLPEHLAKHGRINLSSRTISKRMGEIFLERSSINLSSEYLDMPEYFWQYPSLEDYYTMVEKYLDIASRVDTLNLRLDVLHELFDMLTSQLQHRHSSILEWIIIILIGIEIFFALFQIHFNLL